MKKIHNLKELIQNHMDENSNGRPWGRSDYLICQFHPDGEVLKNKYGVTEAAQMIVRACYEHYPKRIIAGQEVVSITRAASCSDAEFTDWTSGKWDQRRIQKEESQESNLKFLGNLLSRY